MNETRSPSYGLDELHTLVGGVGGMHLRQSLNRLQKANLLHWSENSVSCALADTAEPVGFADVLGQVQNHRRNVPVPRRFLRYLAKSGKRILVATAVGHMLRCLYFRSGECRPEGLCKSSWIAAVFGVDLRNVKAARRELVELGWLVPSSCPQQVLNRHGARMRINLEWGTAKSESPRPKMLSTTQSPPPILNWKLLSKYKHQKPASRRATGVCKADQKKPKRPNIRHIVPDDLFSRDRLEQLHTQAMHRGLVSASESDRLQFFAAAMHARAVATANPCGLFAQLVRKRQWHFITNEDEDRVRQMLMPRHATPSTPAGQTMAVQAQKLVRISALLPKMLPGNRIELETSRQT